jgi:GTP-binding protein Era
MTHKAGFVSIIGKPNAGKSTLMNSLVGEKLSIITPKAQTTRHRILGIVNTEDTQVIFSDTPGIIKPKYGLQKSMMSSVNESLSDADIILWVTDIHERHDEEDVISKLEKTSATYALIINKIDTSNEEEVIAKVEYWKSLLTPKAIIPISALETFNVDTVMQFIMENLPEHPAYYPKDDYFTDRSERFIASEIVREKILNTYKQEIPYSAEVVITSFKEEETIFRISAEIVVERDSQKGILIGRGGETLKKVATSARIDMEKFFGKKVFLEVFVKVIEDWRNKEKYLKQFGYES